MVGYFRDFQENSSLIPSLKKHEQQMAYTYTPGTNRFPRRFSSLQVYNVLKSENAFFYYYYDFLKKQEILRAEILFPRSLKWTRPADPLSAAVGCTFTRIFLSRRHTQ